MKGKASKHLLPKSPLRGLGWKEKKRNTPPASTPLSDQEGKTCCYQDLNPSNGMQPNRKSKTSPRRQRGEATPSPSWVLFEADEATTTFSKAQYSNAQSYLHRKGTPHAEVCKLSHDRLFFVSFLCAQRNERYIIHNPCNLKGWGEEREEKKRKITHPYTPPKEGITCCYQD